jgi:hypothetical protein
MNRTPHVLGRHRRPFSELARTVLDAWSSVRTSLERLWPSRARSSKAEEKARVSRVAHRSQPFDARPLLARLFPDAVIDPPYRSFENDAWIYRIFVRDGSKTLIVPDELPSEEIGERLVGVTELRIRSILQQPGQRRAELVNVDPHGIFVEDRTRPSE